MRFGKKLRNSIYTPWEQKYIDYSKLKQLLREDDPESESREWTEDDEGRFVEELVNVQLEKVNAFQVETYKGLRDRTSECEARLQKLDISDRDARQGPYKEQGENEKRGEDGSLDVVLQELDGISKGIGELEKYSRINYTGFLKAAKKHDRKRSRYRVRPLLQVRLAALPFNSEDYSPLLYRSVMHPAYKSQLLWVDINGRLSTMYLFIRQRVGEDSEKTKSPDESKSDKDTFTSHICTKPLQNVYHVLINHRRSLGPS